MKQFFASCPRGVEAVLDGELAALGAADRQIVAAGVRFSGPQTLGWKACLWLRSATRVQEVLFEGRAATEGELYDAVRALDWTRLMAPGLSLRVDVSVRDAFSHDPRFVMLRIKDAIVDEARDRFGSRPDIARKDPDLPIFAVLSGQSLQLSRTLAPALHRRGYRDPKSKSPLNEALAAALIQLTGWRGEGMLLDPMCGSGTLLIEAALLATNTAPALDRELAFERWPDFDPRAFAKLRDEARKATTRPSLSIVGFDRDKASIRRAQKAADKAGVGSILQLSVGDVADVELHGSPAVVVCNPPWGKRVGEHDADKSMRALGDFLKARCSGASAFVLSGNKALTRHLRLRAAQRYPVAAGPIECRWLRYDIR